MFAFSNKTFTFAIQYRGVEQLVARRAHNPKVVGSSPASATNTKINPVNQVFTGFPSFKRDNLGDTIFSFIEGNTKTFRKNKSQAIKDRLAFVLTENKMLLIKK